MTELAQMMEGEGRLFGSGRVFDVMDTALARFMLELRSRGIIDKHLFDAFEATPRGPFMPETRPGLLYMPINLPLPCGEEAADPFTLARLLVLLDVKQGHSVLEIGSGSGYASVLLSRLAGRVTALERYATLIKQAESAARLVNARNLTFLQADGLGLLDLASKFDRILLHGSVESVPAGLINRLAGGGVMLGHRRIGEATRLVKWHVNAARAVVESDFGPSRATALQAGLPTCL